MNGFSITQEALLATEELVKEKIEAESSTPQEFEAFVKSSENEAIKEREASAEEEGEDLDSTSEGDLNDSNPDEEAPPEEDQTPADAEVPEGEQGVENENAEDSNALADSIDSSPEPTMEALNEWISEKTQHSDSGIVRNLGLLVAGLSYLGIRYGPVLLTYMFKGMLWTFSRLGILLQEGAKVTAAYIEKSRNSMSKLEARLTAAEKSVIGHLNNGGTIPQFEFKDRTAITYLKVKDNVDVNSNIKTFSDSIANVNNSLTREFGSGISVIERIAQSGTDSNVSDIKRLMEINAPSSTFTKGTLPGYSSNSDLIQMYRSEPLWPGDAALLFKCPNIQTNDIDEITKAYALADIFVGINKNLGSPVTSIESYSGAQLVVLCKTARILLAKMKEIDKSQVQMQELRPKIGLKAKQLFMKLADEKAKIAMGETLVEPLYLRSSLVSTVFMSGSTSMMTHSSRVLAALVTFIEAHASKVSVPEQ